MADLSKSLDLAQLFQTVTGTLSDNRQQLNDADDGNHDHGDNMVDTFEVITQAMKQKKGADPADQLKIYLWNPEKKKVGMDDLEISYKVLRRIGE